MQALNSHSPNAVVHKHWGGNTYFFVSLYWATREMKERKGKITLRLNKRGRVVDSFTKMKLMPDIPKFQGTHTFNKWDEEKISKPFWVIPSPCFPEKSVFHPSPAHTLDPFCARSVHNDSRQHKMISWFFSYHFYLSTSTPVYAA